MGYRKVDGKFWTDPVVKKLTCDEKLLFLYCITSPRTHYSGIYYNPLPMIQYETGIDLKGLRKAFGTLRKGLMVYFSEDTGVVFVKNLIKFQKLNANETKGVFNHLPEIQDKEILSIFLDTYPEFSGSNKEPYLTLPKPFLNPLLTLPKPLPNTSEDTETETETDTETDTHTERADKFRQNAQVLLSQCVNPKTLEDFIIHWCEKSPQGRKMAFEKQKVFDIGKRFATWKDNNFNKTEPVKSKQGSIINL